MVKKKSGMMIILSSPSGAGKTTIAKKIVDENPGFSISVSFTTRNPRSNEKDSKDYFFINETKFKQLIQEDYFLEYARVFDNLYGTPKDIVFKNISDGKSVLFDIDWQGTKQIKTKIKDKKLVTIFILPPNIETLKYRLLNREQKDRDVADKRMKNFINEVSHFKDYEYVVINNDLVTCYNKIIEIIRSEESGKKLQYNKQEINETVKDLIK